MSRNSRVLLVLVALLAALLPVGLGSTAYADGCGTLGAADVRSDSPQIDGELVPGVSSTCYTLDLPAGTVVAATINGSLTVRASGGDEPGSCLLDGRAPGPCRLVGQGPFKLTVAQPDDGFRTTPIEFHLHVLALTADDGCAALTAGAPGSDVGLVSDRLIGTDDLACRAVHASTGPLALSSVKGDDVTWTLVAADGTHTCQSPDEVTACLVPSTGDYTLLFSGGRYDSSSSNVVGQVVDLADSSACSSLTPSWRTPAPTAPTRRDGALDCRVVSGLSAGQPVDVPTARSLSLLVGADGRDACHVTDLGCVATGRAPFRYLTASPDTIADSYPILLRTLGPSSDCPVITPLAFGSTPNDSFPNVGCRQFTAEAGHHYDVRTVAGGGLPRDAGVYDEDGNELSCFDGTCDPPGGDVTVLAQYGDTSFTTGLYDLSSDEGCADPGLGLSGHPVTLPPAVVACDRIDVPSETPVITAARGPYGERIEQRYLTASGEPTICSAEFGGWVDLERPCPLRGAGPFRSVTWAEYPTPVSFVVATARADDLGPCRTVASGGHQGTPVTFQSGDPVAKCRTIPATSDPAGQIVHLSHNSGNNFATMVLVEAQRSPDDEGGFTGGTAVVAGRPTSSDTVSRADASYAPINWQPPAVEGTARIGRTVSADIGDWYDPTQSYTYRWIVARQYVAGATRPSFTVPRAAAGRSLAVEVTAHLGNAKRAVRSASVIVPNS